MAIERMQYDDTSTDCEIVFSDEESEEETEIMVLYEIWIRTFDSCSLDIVR